MWADPPEIHGTEYSDMFEPMPAEEYDLTDVPLHQQTKAAARQMCSARICCHNRRRGEQKSLREMVAQVW
jgi:hypothetical protein